MFTDALLNPNPSRFLLAQKGCFLMTLNLCSILCRISSSIQTKRRQACPKPKPARAKFVEASSTSAAKIAKTGSKTRADNGG